MNDYDAELLNASLDLLTYIKDADFIIFLKTNGNLAELNSHQIEAAEKRIASDSPDSISTIRNGLHIFARESSVIHIPVKPAEIKLDPEVKGISPSDIYGTSAHHAAINFIQFNCIGSDFWKTDSQKQFQEFPPIFDLDLLRFQLEWERLRVFDGEASSKVETATKDVYPFREVLSKLDITRNTLNGYLSRPEMKGIPSGLRARYDPITLRRILEFIPTQSSAGDYLKANCLKYLREI